MLAGAITAANRRRVDGGGGSLYANVVQMAVCNDNALPVVLASTPIEGNYLIAFVVGQDGTNTVNGYTELANAIDADLRVGASVKYKVAGPSESTSQSPMSYYSFGCTYLVEIETNAVDIDELIQGLSVQAYVAPGTFTAVANSETSGFALISVVSRPGDSTITGGTGWTLLQDGTGSNRTAKFFRKNGVGSSLELDMSLSGSEQQAAVAVIFPNSV